MLIALDSDNRASLRRLFDRYPCLHGNVAAVIEGGMGKVFADSQQEPHVALAVFISWRVIHSVDRHAPVLWCHGVASITYRILNNIGLTQTEHLDLGSDILERYLA